MWIFSWVFRLLASVNDLPHNLIMGFQIVCLHEGLATLWPAEWFIPSVDFFMGLKIACLRERLATLDS